MTVVQFEFHGGCKDGEIVVGNDNSQSLNNPARRYLFLTDKGRVGARFREIPTKVELQEVMEEIKARLGPSAKPGWEDQVKVLAGMLIAEKRGEIQHTYQVTERDERPDGMRIRLDFVGMDLPSDRA
jgi:hypothetical protein